MSEVDTMAAEVAGLLQKSWNSANGEAFASPFTDDADFVDIRGAHHRSRIAIGKGHQAIFDTIYKGSRIHYVVKQARLLGADTALVHLEAQLDAPTGPLAGKNSSIVSFIALRNGGVWKIASFHNTLIVPSAPPPK